MLLPALGRPRVLAPAPLRLPLAFLHEAFLRSADKRPAVAADCLRLAGVPLAFLQEARLGGACERLALLAHGSAPAGFLREREGKIQRQHQGGQQNAEAGGRLTWWRYVANGSHCWRS